MLSGTQECIALPLTYIGNNMPIDNDLIEQNIAHNKNSLQGNQPSGCPYIYLLDNFLHPDMLTKLLEFIRGYNNWADTVFKGRQVLNWEFDTVVEEVHTSMEAITQEVNQLIGKDHSKFVGLNVWKDVVPFVIDPHTDNPIIGTSIQIYLNDCDADLSTKFEYDGQTLSPKYASNSGYIMDNDFKVRHWMTAPLPQDFVRYSLYGIWKKPD